MRAVLKPHSLARCAYASPLGPPCCLRATTPLLLLKARPASKRDTRCPGARREFTITADHYKFSYTFKTETIYRYMHSGIPFCGKSLMLAYKVPDCTSERENRAAHQPHHT